MSYFKELIVETNFIEDVQSETKRLEKKFKAGGELITSTGLEKFRERAARSNPTATSKSVAQRLLMVMNLGLK